MTLIAEGIFIFIPVPRRRQTRFFCFRAVPAGQKGSSIGKASSRLQDFLLPDMPARESIPRLFKPNPTGDIFCSIFPASGKNRIGNPAYFRKHLGNHQSLRLIVLPCYINFMSSASGGRRNDFHQKPAAVLPVRNRIRSLSRQQFPLKSGFPENLLLIPASRENIPPESSFLTSVLLRNCLLAGVLLRSCLLADIFLPDRLLADLL